MLNWNAKLTYFGYLNSKVNSKAITLALKRPAPPTISFSGDAEERRRNFYSVYLIPIFERRERPIYCTEVSDSAVLGHFIRTDDSPAKPVIVPLSEIGSYRVEIRQYYGHLQITYDDAFDFLRGHRQMYPLRQWAWRGLKQKFYNTRKLEVPARMDVLQRIVDRTVESRNHRANATGLMSAYYGNLWAGHPEGMRLHSHMRFLLDSLVESDDLVYNDLTYTITPKALSTLWTHNIEATRHRDSIALQKVLAWLTLVLAVVGGVDLFIRWD